MQKNFKKIVACGLCCIAILSGCSDSAKKDNNASRESEEKSTLLSDFMEKKQTSVEMVTEIKAKYKNEESIEYTEPLYNLEQDHIFVFKDLPIEVANDCDNIFEVFYDSELKENAYVDVDVEYSDDYTKGTVIIKPSMMYYCGEDGSIDDGTWGSRSKFWLVRYKDLKTGEALEKPIVTVFTIKRDLNTPTLRQSVNKNGEYVLSWTEVEGADYYEVYQRYTDLDYPSLEVSTQELSCTYDNFTSTIESEKRFQETYGDTEVADAQDYVMNSRLHEDDCFFVVAKSYDGKCSGLSNMCNVQEIAHQIPYSVGDFEKNYEGDTSLDLPAYVNMQMKDGSMGEYLIQYHQATVSLLEDGRIMIDAKVKNLDIEMPAIFFEGMEYDEFLEDVELVTQREDALASKSTVSKVDIDIPYLPDGEGEDTENHAPKETKKPENEQEGNHGQEEQQGNQKKKESENVESDIEISNKLKNSVYANSALSEWIAINMLDHKEEIYIGDFQESADTEKIQDAILEAYTQNPLIGVMESVDYDYKRNVIIVSYQLSEEETKQMQEASLKKAEEIANEVVRSGMSDYEKEEAINQYICENSTYNMDIYDYINSDGTVDSEATEKFVHSFTPYGILVENKGVCESYSEAFMMIAREAGLEAIIVTGTMEGVNHEWNRIKLDGKWYSMDVTNNDGDIFKNCYFNLSDEVAEVQLKQDKDALLDNYVTEYWADDMENEYYTKNDLVANDLTEAVEKLAVEIEKNDTAVIRVAEDFSKKEVEKIIEEVCNEKNLGFVKYYNIDGFLAIQKD